MQAPQPLHWCAQVAESPASGTALPANAPSTPDTTAFGSAPASPAKGTTGQISTQRPQPVHASRMPAAAPATNSDSAGFALILSSQAVRSSRSLRYPGDGLDLDHHLRDHEAAHLDQCAGRLV